MPDPSTPPPESPPSLAADDATPWFAGLLQPLAALAIRRGVGLPVLIDAMKLALVRAAVAGQSEGRSLSDSRVSLMTGVHRKDLRRLRQSGPVALGHGHSVASEVFTRWLSDPRWRTRRGGPRVLPWQDSRGDGLSFEALVGSVTRDVHHRAVLDELLRLKLVQARGAKPGRERIHVVASAYVPSADAQQVLAISRDNLADHVAAIAGNLEAGGNRFLEQALFSDELTAATAARFNQQTRAAWEQVFAGMMPKLQALYEADQQSAQPRDHRVRLGLYSYCGPVDRPGDDPYRGESGS